MFNSHLITIVQLSSKKWGGGRRGNGKKKEIIEEKNSTSIQQKMIEQIFCNLAMSFTLNDNPSSGT
jgi:hypothetical protein